MPSVWHNRSSHRMPSLSSTGQYHLWLCIDNFLHPLVLAQKCRLMTKCSILRFPSIISFWLIQLSFHNGFEKLIDFRGKWLLKLELEPEYVPYFVLLALFSAVGISKRRIWLNLNLNHWDVILAYSALVYRVTGSSMQFTQEINFEKTINIGETHVTPKPVINKIQN